MLSTGEIRVVISPDVDVPVSLEVHRQAVGQVGDPVTFDASAEIGETPIHFMAEGQVGQIYYCFWNIPTTLLVSHCIF